MELWLASRPCSLTLGERESGAYWIGRWEGLRAGLDVKEKRKISCSYQESNLDSSVVQPVDRLSAKKKI
jgi:hypothetical protein